MLWEVRVSVAVSLCVNMVVNVSDRARVSNRARLKRMFVSVSDRLRKKPKLL